VAPDGKVDGAVLMLIDIDAAKRGLDFAEAIVETVREPLVILNQRLQVVKANKTFYETFQAAYGRRRKGVLSTTWATANGISRGCASCWRTFSPRKLHAPRL
jgi:hypothetical protein